MTDHSIETRLVDTHTHLDDVQFADDVDDVLARAKAAGVGRVVNIGYRPARWDSTLELAERNPMVSFTLGIHPHHADEWNDDTCRRLETLLDTRGAIAVGEVGVDLYRDGPPLATQQRVFDAQLQLAARKQLPVVIHQRAAEAEVLAILRQVPAELRCILHSFEGSSDMAEFGQERGYYFGVGGLMTRNGSTAVRDILKFVPAELLILETDSPYLAPAGVKDRRNEPANIPRIVERLALLRAAPVAAIEQVTTANAFRAFGLQTRADSAARQ